MNAGMGGGLGGGGMAAKAASIGAKSNLTGAKGPAGARGPQAKDQGKLKTPGADIGREGAVARGQGFSQRDTFQAAMKKDQGPLQRGAPPDPRQQVQQNQPREAVQRDQRMGEGTQAQKVEQFVKDAAVDKMVQQSAQLDDFLKKAEMFRKWIKEMMDIFKPTPA